MATVTVVMEFDGSKFIKVVGVFSDDQMALNYCDKHNSRSSDETLLTDRNELDGLVDDENKPELPSNHPLWQK